MAGIEDDKTGEAKEAGEAKDLVEEADGEELRFSPEEEAVRHCIVALEKR